MQDKALEYAMATADCAHKLAAELLDLLRQAPGEQLRRDADRLQAERDTFERERDAARDARDDLVTELRNTLKARDEARGERDQMRAERDESHLALENLRAVHNELQAEREQLKQDLRGAYEQLKEELRLAIEERDDLRAKLHQAETIAEGLSDQLRRSDANRTAAAKLAGERGEALGKLKAEHERVRVLAGRYRRERDEARGVNAGDSTIEAEVVQLGDEAAEREAEA